MMLTLQFCWWVMKKPVLVLAAVSLTVLTAGCSDGQATSSGSVQPGGGGAASPSSGGALALMSGSAGIAVSLGGMAGADAAGAAAGGSGPAPPKRVCENQPAAAIDCGASCVAVRSNGPPRNRVSLVLLGEGFTAPELTSFYAPHAEGLAKYMFENVNDSEPYVRYKRFINFFRIDLASKESGVDDPATGHYVDTPLDGERGCSDLAGQMCSVNWGKAHDAFDTVLAGTAVDHLDWRWISLNDREACGVTHYPARGALSVYCPYQPESFDIALHEGGHGFSGLADTYWTIDGVFPGSEPSSVNLTKDPSGKKWERWLGYIDPVLGKLGTFEGGGQYTKGIYRPSLNQKMGSKEYCHQPGPPYCPHDAVSREKIIFDIYAIVRPFDSWTKNDVPLVDPEKLTVDVVDCDVVKVDWYVDDKLVAADFGEEFWPQSQGVSRGLHTIEARAHDDTEWVRATRGPLQQTIAWQVELH